MNLPAIGRLPEKRILAELNAPHVPPTVPFLSVQLSQAPVPGQGALGVDQVSYSPGTQH